MKKYHETIAMMIKVNEAADEMKVLVKEKIVIKRRNSLSSYKEIVPHDMELPSMF